MQSPVVAAWSQFPVLMNRAAVGRLAIVIDAKSIDRADVISNADVITPVLQFHGTRVNVNLLTEEVEEFFPFARPRGRPPVPRHLCCNSDSYSITFVVPMDL